MNTLSIKRDISHYRFALSNAIWSRKFKPPTFAVLAYLQYRHSRKFGNAATPKEPAERTIHIENKGMRDTLENLYFGNITPNEQDITPGSVLADAMDQAEQCEEKLTALPEGEEKTLLLRLLNAENEICSTMALENFTPGSVLADAIDRAEQCEEKFTTLLEGEEKTLLLQLLNAENEISSTMALENFILGFRLGMRIAIESLEEDDGSLTMT